jgi:hypothetical protein
MHRTLTTFLLAALAACGDRAPAGSLRIALEVTEGSHAGRYRAAAGGAACTWDIPGSGSLAVRFTDPDSGAALSSLQLVVSSDGRVYLGVLFGGFRTDGRRHEIETRAGKPRLGTGSAVVNRRDGRTFVDIRGRTGDGVPLTVRVQCSSAASAAASGT